MTGFAVSELVGQVLYSCINPFAFLQSTIVTIVCASLFCSYLLWYVGKFVFGMWFARAAKTPLRMLIDNIDREDLDSTDVGTRTTGMSHGKRTKYIAAAISRDCRSRFGFKSRSAANEMVARKWMYDRLRKIKDLRHSDCGAILNLACVVVFLPDELECECNDMIKTFEYRSRAAGFVTSTWFPSFSGNQSVSG